MKVLGDFTIQADHVSQARRPDIIVKDKEMNQTWIIDIVVEKYLDLTKEIRQLWQTSASVIPIVGGALVAVVSLDEYMNMLDIEKRKVEKVQFSALSD